SRPHPLSPSVDAARVSVGLTPVLLPSPPKRGRGGKEGFAGFRKGAIMNPTRRNFLKSTGLVALGLNAPLFVSRTAAAAPPGHKPGAKDTILVVIELNGGNDGLNTVIPFK